MARNLKNRNDIYFGALGRLLKTYFVFLVVFTIFRLVFTFYFGNDQILTEYQADLLKAFYNGWRYDNLVISYVLVPFYLIYTVVSILGKVSLVNFINFFSKFYFSIMGVLLPIILFCDLGFYSYFQDHINILFFGLFEDDTKALAETIWKDYPIEYALIGFAVYVLGIVWFFNKNFKFLQKKGSFFEKGAFKFISIFLVSFVLFVGALRGGYGDMVISPKYNDFSESEFINQIAINGVVALEKTIKIRQEQGSKNFNFAKSMGYGDDIHRAFGDFIGIDVSPTKEDQLINLIMRKTPQNGVIEETKPHVIVLIMESFGSHWMKYNSKEFNFLGELKNHFDKDYFFPYFASSDNGTIGSLLAIATNIPHRHGARFLSESKYLQMPLETSSHVPYKKRGYETNFLYGGKLGWRDIGKYFKHQGFHNVYGQNAMLKNLALTGRVGTEWGMYDEHLFNYIHKELEKSSRPQFVMALSTTNHPPFEFPASFKAPTLNLPAELEKKITREKPLFIERFKAFQYSNYKLAEFITKIKNSPLGEKTIIAVTGDHNFWGFMNYEKDEMFLKHTVPFYVYVPKKIFSGKVNTDKVASHEDIMTTLYNVSLSDTEFISFGENLFSEGPSSALNNAFYASKEEGIVYRGVPYKWEKFPYVKKVKASKVPYSLNKHYKSSLSVADFYLRFTFENRKK